MKSKSNKLEPRESRAWQKTGATLENEIGRKTGATRLLENERTPGVARLLDAVRCKVIGSFVAAQEGEGFIDVLVKMLIVVVVGAVLLAIMRTAIPQMFTDMMTKIRDTFFV